MDNKEKMQEIMNKVIEAWFKNLPFVIERVIEMEDLPEINENELKDTIYKAIMNKGA